MFTQADLLQWDPFPSHKCPLQESAAPSLHPLNPSHDTSQDDWQYGSNVIATCRIQFWFFFAQSEKKRCGVLRTAFPSKCDWITDLTSLILLTTEAFCSEPPNPNSQGEFSFIFITFKPVAMLYVLCIFSPVVLGFNVALGISSVLS